MELKPVTSGNISAIGYDAKSRDLCIRFKNGTEWTYADVSAEKVGLLMTAESIGGYFSLEIKPHYRAKSSKSVDLVKPIEPKRIMQTAQEDDCCRPLYAEGIADLNSWTCPKCGSEWKPVPAGTLGVIRHWQPVEVARVFRLPGT